MNVIGDVDLATVPNLRSCLAEACRDGRPVVIELGGCTFLDSVGVGLLLGAARRAPAGLSVVGATGAVRTLLAVTGFDQLVTVLDEP